MAYNIAVLKGDGIGREVIDETIKVLNKISEKYKIEFNFKEALIGGIAYDETGEPLPIETIDLCKKSDAALLGAVGGEKWDKLPSDKRPEAGLLGIRKALSLYANVRPAVLLPALKDSCPLKEDISSKGIDITIVRELTGGIYFGKHATEKNDTEVYSYDIEQYSESEIKRIAITAFELAMKKKKRVISVDKANVLESSKLWRSTVEKVSKSYPEVELSNMYVDNASMQMIKDPSQFDVVVTSNIFGDILSDEAAQIAGSIGVLPSLSMGEGSFGLYEPVHGSAPDIAGKNIANPIATILSSAMMLRFSLNEKEAADSIENAVNAVLEKGYKTADLNKESYISCTEMGDLICKEI